MRGRRQRALGVALLGAAGGLGALGACGPGAAAERARAELELELAAARAELASRAEEQAARRAEREAALAEGAEEVERLTARLADLTAELGRKEEQRVAREREWLAFTRALSALELRSLPDGLAFETDAGLAAGAEPEEPAPAPPLDPIAERSEEIHRALRGLLLVDGLRGMDLLESGRLGDGWTGPVVFRLVDGAGRLAGSLFAARLRLEGSRAARTVTLVLEEGYETWRGGRTEFDRGGLDPSAPNARRVVLPRVSPEPWFEALPELFAETELDRAIDDGAWSAALVRGALNDLLRREAGGGYFKLKSLGGVLGEVLREVHLEGYDRDGRLERHLFADRLRILPQEKGVLLQLEDGAQVRGEEKAAFLDGHFRIFLPRADLSEWAARGLPGVAPPGVPGPGAGPVDATVPAGG